MPQKVRYKRNVPGEVDFSFCGDEEIVDRADSMEGATDTPYSLSGCLAFKFFAKSTDTRLCRWYPPIPPMTRRDSSMDMKHVQKSPGCESLEELHVPLIPPRMIPLHLGGTNKVSLGTSTAPRS